MYYKPRQKSDGDSGLDYLVFLTIWYVPIVVTTHCETVACLRLKER